MTTKTTVTVSIIPRANDDDEDEDMLPRLLLLGSVRVINGDSRVPAKFNVSYLDRR
jgi:hypothetical protein